MSLVLFALPGSEATGAAIGSILGISPAPLEERRFEDGEHKIRPLESVRGADVYLLQSLHRDEKRSPDEKLVQLLMLLGAVRDASAARVTVIAPYLCYSRKDARTQARDPVSSRYVAQLLEALGCDRILTLEVHNPAAYQNAFRIPAEHIEGTRLLGDALLDMAPVAEAVVVSPDPGGVKRAEHLRAYLSRRLGSPVTSAFMEKHRSGGVVSGERLVGDVTGKTALIIDDLVSSGTSLSRVAAACSAAGATRILAAATHALFSNEADEVLAAMPVEALLVTDTVALGLLSPQARTKVRVIPAAFLLADAIRALHTNTSLSALS
jgi:ribose-phosphate pyrophosphokinase